MELLYVWIERFRNIDNKGFNFSSQYDINFDQGSNAVTVNLIDGGNALIVESGVLKFKNVGDHYLDEFFSINTSDTSNISNISALIGKNSSGKSNVIDFVLTAIGVGNRDRLTSKTNPNDPTRHYVLIFKKGDRLYFFGRTLECTLNDSTITGLEVPVTRIQPETEVNVMFYSNVADNKEYIFEGNSVYNFSFTSINKLQSNKIQFVLSDLFRETWQRVNPENHAHRKIRFIFNPTAFLELERNQENHPKIAGILKRYRKAIYKESTSNYNRFKYSLSINLFSFLVQREVEVSSFLSNIRIVGSEGYAETITSLNPKIINYLTTFDAISAIPDITEEQYNIYRDLIADLQRLSLDLGDVERFSNSVLVDVNEDFKTLLEGKYEAFNIPSLISHD